eukprot:jgi/Astpho2/9555/Aster-x1585
MATAGDSSPSGSPPEEQPLTNGSPAEEDLEGDDLEENAVQHRPAADTAVIQRFATCCIMKRVDLQEQGCSRLARPAGLNQFQVAAALESRKSSDRPRAKLDEAEGLKVGTNDGDDEGLGCILINLIALIIILITLIIVLIISEGVPEGRPEESSEGGLGPHPLMEGASSKPRPPGFDGEALNEARQQLAITQHGSCCQTGEVPAQADRADSSRQDDASGARAQLTNIMEEEAADSAAQQLMEEPRQPVQLVLFMEPVLLAEDGHTYEAAALRGWLDHQAVSPMTGLTLTTTTIVPNHAVKATIEALRRSCHGDPLPS